MDIYSEGARFTVICTRCQTKFEVIRNWVGSVRRDSPKIYRSNPAKCSCSSLSLEVF